MLPLSHRLLRRVALAFATVCMLPAVFAQIGTRFPSERKVVADPVTGIPLTFLTSQEQGDSKIYQTHHQWTSDGQWIVFRSNRVRGEAMAVNEKTGDLVQVTEGGYAGMLCLADNSMTLYFLRAPMEKPAQAVTGAEPATGGQGRGRHEQCRCQQARTTIRAHCAPPHL